jgi:hypothetical protein
MVVGVRRHDPAALHPGKGPEAHFTGGCVRPRTVLDACGKYRPYRDSIPGRRRP